MATPNMNLQTLIASAATLKEVIVAFNRNMQAIDTHTHESLKGVRVPLSALLSDSDLDLLNQVLRNLRSSSYSNQETDYSENNSIYFKGGELFIRDGGGQVVQITTNGRLTDLTNPVVQTETVYFGLSDVQSGVDISEATVQAQVTTAFNNPTNRQSKQANLMRLGSYVRYQAPNPQGYYYVWFAGLQANINTLKFHTMDGQEDQFWTFVSTVVIGTSNYNLYARRTPIQQSQEIEIIARSYL